MHGRGESDWDEVWKENNLREFPKRRFGRAVAAWYPPTRLLQSTLHDHALYSHPDHRVVDVISVPHDIH